ncbi:allantoicase [Streptacidiphilus fuscans]|uniref:Allantoicase n=1 Tax=Streptacidiphilus fuscans TaxID=2789292 RepID=A0A931BB75_9ACTN|nr:allantoicase [Streptacidiphilus fuscans]MBF9070215.1 allantoicase [Streptacidiphilus fuscans]
MPVALLDLTGRDLGASVVASSDDSAGRHDALLRVRPPVATAPGTTPDAWRARRRTAPVGEWVIVRLGEPGVLRTVVLDTRHLHDDCPDSVTVQAHCWDGYPAAEQLTDPALPWTTLLRGVALRPDAENAFDVTDPHRYTHLRIIVQPDGALARLRAHGTVVPDTTLLRAAWIDLAAQENGAVVVDHCGEHPHAPAARLTVPGGPDGPGWVPPRRRDASHDWVHLRLAAEGTVRQVDIDTSFQGVDAPSRAALYGLNASDSGDDLPRWFELLPATPLLPDTRHRFLVPTPRPSSHVRLDLFPGGGASRLRLWGELAPAGRASLALGWLNTLPGQALTALLDRPGTRGTPGPEPGQVETFLADRPFTSLGQARAAAPAALLTHLREETHA